MPRSRSRSRSRSRGRRSRSFSRSRSRSSSVEEGFRVHVADLGIDCSKREIERAFEKYGPVIEVWLAKNPPCFAFVVFRHKEDADEAIRDMSGKTLCGSRIRCSNALPRSRGRRLRRGYDPNLRCYTCGDRGHFSRDCEGISRGRFGGFGRRFSRSPSPYRSRGRRYMSRSRSRSPRRNRRSRSRSPRRSRSRSKSESKRGRKARGSKSPTAQNGKSVSRSRSRSL